MTTRRQTANDDRLLWALKLIPDNPSITQRCLAKEVGINVSSINCCIKALIENGWINMGNFSRNPEKLSYVPTDGLAEGSTVALPWYVGQKK